MERTLVVAVAAYGIGLATCALVTLVRRSPPGILLRAASAFFEGIVVFVAVVETIRWLIGGEVRQPIVHACYLIASVVLLPILMGSRALRATEHDLPTPSSDAAVIVVAAIALVVVEIRLVATGMGF